MEQARCHVVVAGPRPAMAEALAGLLGSFEDVSTCVSGLSTTSERCSGADSAVIVLDIDGDRADMLASLVGARAHAPDAPVVTLQCDAADATPGDVGELARLSKDVTPEELVQVVRTLKSCQETALRPRQIDLTDGATPPDRFATLTEREREVLGLLVTGAPNSAIGSALDISSHTVRSHVRSLIFKLGCKDRFDVATSAHQLGQVVYAQQAAR